MSATLDPGFHAAAGKPVDSLAYDAWVGRWSRLFVPMVIEAADIAQGDLVLDVSTGTGEAAAAALQAVGASGRVVGADIAPPMLASARKRLADPLFWPVAADGQALPFRDEGFDAVVCQLGLQFFPDPARGLSEFRRVLARGAKVAICVISTPDRAPMWGIPAEHLAQLLPAQRHVLSLSFSLADQSRLHDLLADAGFRDVRVERVRREDTIESFEAYWQPIEAGIGSIPQIYHMLSQFDRDAVRNKVKAKLAQFAIDGRLTMAVEMMIGSGRA
jgi:ubiquinone/menaquinone biosynthesis C-methylase UbiE